MNADERKCPQCAELVKAEARICRFCGHSFENVVPSDTSGSLAPPKAGGAFRKGWLILLGIVVVLVIIGSRTPRNDQAASTADAIASADALASGEQSSRGADEAESGTIMGLVGPQANAARSAQQYLNMTGFSRQGLIDQLSSDAGEGYGVADATAAVDSLSADWNEQAARSAKQYLQMTGFSCSGLIEQLSSKAGSKYTESQARYGAAQAGAC